MILIKRLDTGQYFAGFRSGTYYKNDMRVMWTDEYENGPVILYHLAVEAEDAINDIRKVDPALAEGSIEFDTTKIEIWSL